MLGDSWNADERGAAISVYSLMPLIGPAVGPIAGGFITENTTWRVCHPQLFSYLLSEERGTTCTKSSTLELLLSSI